MTELQKNFPEQKGKAFVFQHYGYSPTLVHRNPDLSPGAKGLYSYLSTFVNADQMKQGKLHAWPSRQRILQDMNISVNTFGKYLGELKEAGFIHVEQTRKTLKGGKQGFGTNLYILQTHVTDPSGEEISVREDCVCESEPNSHAESDLFKTSDSIQVNTSNTKGFSITKNNSNTKFSTIRQGASQSQDPIIQPEEDPYPQEEKEKGITLDALLTSWNQTGVNPHYRLGKTRRSEFREHLIKP